MKKFALSALAILFLATLAYALSGMSPEVINNIWTFEKAPKFTSLTASRILSLDANKNLTQPTIGANGTVLQADGTNEAYVAKNTFRAATAHNFATLAASWTLSADEQLCLLLVTTNANASATIRLPATDGKVFILRNGSGQNNVILPAGNASGITVATATARMVIYDSNSAEYLPVGTAVESPSTP